MDYAQLFRCIAEDTGEGVRASDILRVARALDIDISQHQADNMIRYAGGAMGDKEFEQLAKSVLHKGKKRKR